jgi:hypothetical protein
MARCLGGQFSGSGYRDELNWTKWPGAEAGIEGRPETISTGKLEVFQLLAVTLRIKAH